MPFWSAEGFWNSRRIQGVPDSWSRKTQGVASKRMPEQQGQCSRTLGRSRSNECRLMPVCYIESMQKGIPPPFAERQEPFTPIIFRTKKVEKSSPQENIIFRTKNTEKSHLGLIGKNFGKNLQENVSGVKGKPPILWRGGKVLIMTKDL